MNLQILNKENQSAEINIYGDIGESWFGEGITLKSVSDQIKNLGAEEITVNIASLGGNTAEALGIYAELKTSPARIKTVIKAPTASSGTIIAMAGDEIEIMDTAMFLVHNNWTIAAGNKNDFRDTADDLEKWDNTIIPMYAKKTGKRKSQVQTKMNEGKWMSPQEALDFGFVTKIITGEKISAHLIEKINNSGLPKIEIKNQDMENKSIVDVISAKFEAFKNEFFAKTTDETLKKEFETKLEAEKKNAIDEANKILASVNVEEVVKNETEKITAEVKKMQEDNKKALEAKDAEIAKIKAEKTIVQGKPDSQNPETVEDGHPMFNYLAARLKKELKIN